MASNGNPKSTAIVCSQDMSEVQKVFNRFDANGDGMISAEELTGVLEALGSDASPKEVNQIMADIDADKDGFINLQEFAGFCKGGGDGADADAEKDIREAFDLYDQDGNGLISAVELHKILTRLGERCSVEDCAGMIKSVDSDGDGNVSFEEFRKMMASNPKI